MKHTSEKQSELPPIVSLRDRDHVLALEFVRAARNFAASGPRTASSAK